VCIFWIILPGLDICFCAATYAGCTSHLDSTCAAVIKFGFLQIFFWLPGGFIFSFERPSSKIIEGSCCWKFSFAFLRRKSKFFLICLPFLIHATYISCPSYFLTRFPILAFDWALLYFLLFFFPNCMDSNSARIKG